MKIWKHKKREIQAFYEKLIITCLPCCDIPLLVVCPLHFMAKPPIATYIL